MLKRYLVAGISILFSAGAVIAPELFPSAGNVPEPGMVLSDSIEADADAIPFNIFVEGLISKRNTYDDSNCSFLVSEEIDGNFSSWKGELFWGDAQDYKIFFGNPQKGVLVSRSRVYALGEAGDKTELGRTDDGSRGASAYRSARGYVFENFLLEAGQSPQASRLLGDETIDGARYFVLENDIVMDAGTRAKRKFWVSEEGIFFKAEIEEDVEGYEVYDSAGAPVEQAGYVKHINIEVEHRTFF